MEYLVIGGAGFIGLETIKFMTSSDVVIFDNFSSLVHDQHSFERVTNLKHPIHVGDVRRRCDVADLLDRYGVPRVIIHLAAETGTGRSLHNCHLNSHVNVLGLSNVLDEISSRNAFPEKIILTSTRAVYGEGPYIDLNDKIHYPTQRSKYDLINGKFTYDCLSPLKVDAQIHSPAPINVYGVTKLAQENLLKVWCNSFDVDFTIFRLQNVYGAGQALSNPYTGILLHFVREALAGRSIEIYENGEITRDFIHVTDVAKLLSSAAIGEGHTGLFDCGSGERVHLFNIATRIASILNAPIPKPSNKFRIGDVLHAAASIQRTSSLFDWVPNRNIDDGLSELITYIAARSKT